MTVRESKKSGTKKKGKKKGARQSSLVTSSKTDRKMNPKPPQIYLNPERIQVTTPQRLWAAMSI
jgi:hypothetical protein